MTDIMRIVRDVARDYRSMGTSNEEFIKEFDWYNKIIKINDKFIKKMDYRSFEVLFNKKMAELTDREILFRDEANIYKELLRYSFAHKDGEIKEILKEIRHVCNLEFTNKDFCLSCCYYRYLKHYREIIEGMNL